MKIIIVEHSSLIDENNTYVGESLETKMARIITNKEPIDSTSPIIFTERKDGVLPQYDIRTDRFEIAQNATESISKGFIAKREEKGGISTGEEIGKPESSHRTEVE